MRIAQRAFVRRLRVVAAQREVLSRQWSQIDGERVLVVARLQHTAAVRARAEEMEAERLATEAAKKDSSLAVRRMCVVCTR